MQLRDLCFYSLITVLLISSLYLAYLTATIHMPMIYKLRFMNFILEHLLGIVALIKRKFYCIQEDTFGYLLWMIGFTGVNFVNFISIELYGLISSSANSQPRLQGLNIPFIVLSYFHLYYQLNIYLGVFCLFSVAMGIIYFINRRRHTEEVEEVLQQLKSEKYQDNQREQNCSICLTDFQKSESVYKLVCGHTFHKDCLKDWFKQKLTCPMCRDDVARGIHQREQREYYDGDELENWHGPPPAQYYNQQYWGGHQPAQPNNNQPQQNPHNLNVH